jgi:hypothetical protein
MKKYELKQNGKRYILSSQIFNDKLRFACIDYSNEPEKIYIAEYVINDLIQLNSIFSSLTEISKAQEIFDMLITKQKVSIETKDNYLNLNIIIKKENQLVERFTIKLSLFSRVDNKIITHINKEININQYNLTTQSNNINENLLSSPIINNNDNEIKGQYIKNITNNIITQEENVTSPAINSENNITNSNKDLNLHSDIKDEISLTANYQVQNNDIDSQEEHKITSNNMNEINSADDFIKQYLQSTGNISSQKNSNEQYNQFYNIGQLSQNKQISNNNITSEAQNKLNINIIASNAEGQNFEDNNQVNTNIISQKQFINKPSEISNNINLDNYFQQSASNIENQNQYIQSFQKPSTNITTSTSTSQTQYVQIPTSTITTQKQYIVQNQPIESQTINYNMTQNQVKKTKAIKTEKIILQLLPQKQEPKMEEVNYENSAQIYSQQQEIQTPQVIIKDNPELDNLRNENARLLEEINSLKSQIKITTVKQEIPNESYQEIQILREEIEKLRLELSTYNEYKSQKEEEINMLSIKIQNLLNKIKELEMRNEDLRAYIEKLSQMKSEKGYEALSLQDTRLEIIRGEIIETANELELITRKMCQNKYKKISLNLLYKAIVDSDKAEIFHQKCDSAKSTLVLIKGANGKRFGGFTSCSWEGNSIEKKDENAFIFSFDKMKIYNVIPGEGAIGCYPNFGPVFLGCQIRIYNEFFSKGGSTFEKGVNFNTEEDYELTGGLKTFDINDIEVYSVELIE